MSREPSLPVRPAARRRMGVAIAAGKLLGTPVAAAVPLQRHDPRLVLAVSVGELAALALLVATGSAGAMAVLILCSVLLTVVGTTNRRRVLALTGKGNVMLSASITGWPNGVQEPIGRRTDLPEPARFGVAVDVAGSTWWIERSSFPALRRALAVQTRRDDE